MTPKSVGDDWYRLLFQTVGNAIMIADVDGQLVQVNDRATELTGFSREELLGMTVADLVEGEQADIRDEFDVLYQESREHGTRFRAGKRRMLRSDGTSFPFEIEASLLPDGSVAAVVWDITERQAAASALRASEKRYRTLYEGVPIGLFRSSGGGGMIDVNFALVRMLGYPDRETLLSTDASDLYADPQDQRALKALLEDRDMVEDFEVCFKCYDGTPIWVRKTVRLDRTAEGHVRYYDGAVHEITERKAAEGALRSSEQRYRNLFEQDLAGHFISTPEGELRACNAACAQMFGFSSVGEALETSAQTLHSDTRIREDFFNAIRKKGKVEGYTAQLRRVDGKPIHVIENAYGVFDDNGELLEVRGHMIDVTERKRLEEQLRHAQKMEAIGRLAGGIAHDFNNLMMTVGGYTDLLLQELESAGDETRSDLEEIRAAAKRATALTRQLLAFSRKQVLTPRVVDVNVLLADVQRMLSRVVGADVELEADLTDDIGNVKTDPTQIEQVIMNLVVNARDAMPDGGTLTLATARVAVGATRAERLDLEPGVYTTIEVRDTGTGIPPDVRARMFEPFFTTKEKGTGTGLGLATAYGIVKQSGGVIEVESTTGDGSTFRVYLPETDENAAHDGVAAAVVDDSGPGGSERIMVAEDEAPVRSLLHRVLTDAGYDVLQAADGEEALEVARALDAPIDLLLTDVVMPAMGGRTLAERIVLEQPEIALLFLSGYSAGAVESYGIFDMDAIFCAKPVEPDELLRKVRQALDRSRARA